MRRNIYGIFFLSMRARSVKLRVCFYFFFSCYVILLYFGDIVKALIFPSALKHMISSSVFAHAHNLRT